ncbi:TetR/AcrR family transcriptional regulator [Plesiomonas shigelloides subsp. oncorhynchi]|uniref:TetR family transcriptional regulator n=2 Tax=Plesiomonas shigelloides TaxID=703 RepID=R8ALH9_PLESH|nr:MULTISPECIES: TetR/AcrR family transcriptional regulator [Plesiomonas]MDO4687965.1 TetR/AcrR family transcriptional regulator [Plesiomonas sp.]EON87191.1 TetR family transcriptional regulator [Plesiomonas shigelloides 302-73]KAB7657552.1 TetR family transcriptional regulator [Plesiomonas shigelloides]KAB7667432.1 TetR family transcriptional regulator [Plesiomonas shigelloides]KAB7669874.1 TetR family transcriptional regulator [Plesiomonas shigelloides]
MKTRDRIIQTSLELFNQRGERNVTTNHIAAHLGISPGNLYYHFRNKEDIIHAILCEYADHLALAFQPKQQSELSLDVLMGYLDAIFYTMWRYRFFYANLADLLGRDERLQRQYLAAQADLDQKLIAIMRNMHASGLLDMSAEALPEFVHTMKLIVTCWIPYQSTQSPQTLITRQVVYQGVLSMLNLMRPMMTPVGKERIERLSAHYREQLERELHE